METIKRILCELHPECESWDSSDLIQDGTLDSFDIVNLISEMEKAYGIAIRGEDVTAVNFCSLDRMQQLIRRYREDESAV